MRKQRIDSDGADCIICFRELLNNTDTIDDNVRLRISQDTINALKVVCVHPLVKGVLMNSLGQNGFFGFTSNGRIDTVYISGKKITTDLAPKHTGRSQD